ncbi:MAG: hypothetical protein RLZZ450_4728 [Pseudomonadota bacterium]
MLIAHATEHFDETDSSFIHAIGLAAAHRTSAEVVTLHITQGLPEAAPAPRAASLLERWKAPPALSVSQRVHECAGHDDIADELIAACGSLRPDLVIMSTHARTGLLRVLAGSVAEAVARNLQVPALLLPVRGRGFIDAESGSLDLTRLLVLGGSESDAQRGIDAAAWLVHVAGRNSAELMVLHVGSGTHAPAPRAPEGMQIRSERRLGELDQVAAAVTEDWQPALLVMVSHGHDELRDVLWSSHTERVLHAAARPLLWVPATWKP